MAAMKAHERAADVAGEIAVAVVVERAVVLDETGWGLVAGEVKCAGVPVPPVPAQNSKSRKKPRDFCVAALPSWA